MNNIELIPGTVCCILCRGLVIYKNGDKSRFKAHLANEHGAFFDNDYILASSLMEAEQKEKVAKTVNLKTMDPESSLVENSSYHESVSFQETTKKNITRKGSNKREKKTLKNTSSETAKVIIEDKTQEQNVIFNPSTGCIACQEGRKGEGDKSCWGCRLRRMQNKQEILLWNRKKEE